VGLLRWPLGCGDGVAIDRRVQPCDLPCSLVVFPALNL
jgi:hypothetical protein